MANSDFVRFCYQRLLGREPDQAGAATHLQALNSGAVTREGLIRQFLESEEFICAYQDRLPSIDTGAELAVANDTVESASWPISAKPASGEANFICPEEIIRRYTVEELCESADQYFQLLENPDELLAKPFHSLIETPASLSNMGALLAGLHIGKSMTVLEFAAGSCWFSRYLNQLQCRTISCDASATALEIGQRLFVEYPIVGELVAEPEFLLFDGHKIDLPDESVDRIVCFDGFHHVPNQEEVIAELARVLKPGGIAGFSEPGKTHSRSPRSQADMKNYTVLENDIDIHDIAEIGQKYGFTDAKVRLLAEQEINLSQYSLVVDAEGTRPQAQQQLWQLLHRDIANLMRNKTIFFLYKGEFVPDSRSAVGLAHRLSVANDRVSVNLDDELCLLLMLENTGVARWLSQNICELGIVYIGTHLYTEDGNLIKLSHSTHFLEQDMPPGTKCEQTIGVRFPRKGTFCLTIDLVAEGVSWFENLGSLPLQITVVVT